MLARLASVFPITPHARAATASVRRAARWMYLWLVLAIALAVLPVNCASPVGAYADDATNGGVNAAITYAQDHVDWVSATDSSPVTVTCAKDIGCGKWQPRFECAEFVTRALIEAGLISGLDAQTAQNKLVEPRQGGGAYTLVNVGGSSTQENTVTGLYDYLLATGVGQDMDGSIPSNSIDRYASSVHLGDVVFFESTQGIEHVALITSIKDGTPHYTAHNVAELDAPLTSAYLGSSFTAVRIVHIAYNTRVTAPAISLHPAVQMIAPKPNTTVSSWPILSWQPVTGATGYEVALFSAVGDGYAGTPQWGVSTKLTSIQPAVSHPGAYYFSIEPVSRTLCWLPLIATFTYQPRQTQPPAPTKLLLTSISDGSSIAHVTLTPLGHTANGALQARISINITRQIFYNAAFSITGNVTAPLNGTDFFVGLRRTARSLGSSSILFPLAGNSTVTLPTITFPAGGRLEIDLSKFGDNAQEAVSLAALDLGALMARHLGGIDLGSYLSQHPEAALGAATQLLRALQGSGFDASAFYLDIQHGDYMAALQDLATALQRSPQALAQLLHVSPDQIRALSGNIGALLGSFDALQFAGDLLTGPNSGGFVVTAAP